LSAQAICYTCIVPRRPPCRLPPEIEQRLDALAKKTGRSKSYYAREAILRHIEDVEDDYLARRRLARGGPRVTLERLERELKRRTKRR
jgi:RHH-type transcriptional regulator, rel operon repressor / antitoxin RelB